MSTLTDLLIKNTPFPEDIIKYTLTDYLVGDEKYWRNKFNNCSRAIVKLTGPRWRVRRNDNRHMVMTERRFRVRGFFKISVVLKKTNI